MKIAAYQFAVTNNLDQNMKQIQNALLQASHIGVKLLVFPECALTGYPPRDLEASSCVSFHELSFAFQILERLSTDYAIHLIVGTITQENKSCYNSAALFSPNQNTVFYHKRALWGWDLDNFCMGNEKGVFDVEGWNIGIRICYEVRFPEFFRELYLKQTDLNVILFYDVSDFEDAARYDLMKAHIQTRAVENVTPALSVNTTRPYQTAPTGLYGASGRPLAELTRGKEGLLVYDLKQPPFSFGEQGRKQISDQLLYKD